MTQDKAKLCVFYDGACPQCVEDRMHYEKLAGSSAKHIFWMDITGHEQQLTEFGIDPVKAMNELHVRDEHGQIHVELDAYILIMSRVPLLCPIAWLIGLPLIRPLLSRIYHWQVHRRLLRSGRVQS